MRPVTLVTLFSIPDLGAPPTMAPATFSGAATIAASPAGRSSRCCRGTGRDGKSSCTGAARRRGSKARRPGKRAAAPPRANAWVPRPSRPVPTTTSGTSNDPHHPRPAAVPDRGRCCARGAGGQTGRRMERNCPHPRARRVSKGRPAFRWTILARVPRLARRLQPSC